MAYHFTPRETQALIDLVQELTDPDARSADEAQALAKLIAIREAQAQAHQHNVAARQSANNQPRRGAGLMEVTK